VAALIDNEDISVIAGMMPTSLLRLPLIHSAGVDFVTSSAVTTAPREGSGLVLEYRTRNVDVNCV